MMNASSVSSLIIPRSSRGPGGTPAITVNANQLASAVVSCLLFPAPFPVCAKLTHKSRTRGKEEEYAECPHSRRSHV